MTYSCSRFPVFSYCDCWRRCYYLGYSREFPHSSIESKTATVEMFWKQWCLYLLLGIGSANECYGFEKRCALLSELMAVSTFSIVKSNVQYYSSCLPWRDKVACMVYANHSTLKYNMHSISHNDYKSV